MSLNIDEFRPFLDDIGGSETYKSAMFEQTVFLMEVLFDHCVNTRNMSENLADKASFEGGFQVLSEDIPDNFNDVAAGDWTRGGREDSCATP